MEKLLDELLNKAQKKAKEDFEDNAINDVFNFEGSVAEFIKKHCPKELIDSINRAYEDNSEEEESEGLCLLDALFGKTTEEEENGTIRELLSAIKTFDDGLLEEERNKLIIKEQEEQKRQLVKENTRLLTLIEMNKINFEMFAKTITVIDATVDQIVKGNNINADVIYTIANRHKLTLEQKNSWLFMDLFTAATKELDDE